MTFRFKGRPLRARHVLYTFSLGAFAANGTAPGVAWSAPPVAAAPTATAAPPVKVAPPVAQADDEALLRGPLDGETVARITVARSFGVRAAHARARSEREAARAEGRLPDPELMFEAWQVPLEKPASFRDAQMVSVGLRQTFPAPGSLGPRDEARVFAATELDAMAADRARQLRAAALHAVADLEEASRRHASHRVHEGLADRIRSVAEARLRAGGRLGDVAQAEVESARIEADVAEDEARTATARAKLNALLLRATDAPLGPVTAREPTMVADGDDALVRRALATRPELRAAAARTAAAQAEARAADAEATWPAFTVGLSYFAPTTLMPFHGYGLSAGASLPWLWGGAAPRKHARTAASEATRLEAKDQETQTRFEIASALGQARAATARVRTMRDRTLPAARRALDVTLAAYEGSQGDLATVVNAEKTLVEMEVDLIAAEATLEHALIDLELVVGAPVGRIPIDAEPTKETRR